MFRRLLDSLEIRYLANRDDNLFFALLTDLRHAHAQRTAGRYGRPLICSLPELKI
jgi:hypothetical protein